MALANFRIKSDWEQTRQPNPSSYKKKDEEVRNFKYLACHLDSNRNLDVQNKLQWFDYKCGTIISQKLITKYWPQRLLFMTAKAGL
jgi:hypothetical protein